MSDTTETRQSLPDDILDRLRNITIACTGMDDSLTAVLTLKVIRDAVAEIEWLRERLATGPAPTDRNVMKPAARAGGDVAQQQAEQPRRQGLLAPLGLLGKAAEKVGLEHGDLELVRQGRQAQGKFKPRRDP